MVILSSVLQIARVIPVAVSVHVLVDAWSCWIPQTNWPSDFEFRLFRPLFAGILEVVLTDGPVAADLAEMDAGVAAGAPDSVVGIGRVFQVCC